MHNIILVFIVVVATLMAIASAESFYYLEQNPAKKCGQVPSQLMYSKSPIDDVCDGQPEGTRICACIKDTATQVLADRLVGILMTVGVLFDPKTTPLIVDKFPLEGFNDNTKFRMTCGSCLAGGAFLPYVKDRNGLKYLMNRPLLSFVIEGLHYLQFLAEPLPVVTSALVRAKQDTIHSSEVTTDFYNVATFEAESCDKLPSSSAAIGVGLDSACQGKAEGADICVCSNFTQTMLDAIRMVHLLPAVGKELPPWAPISMDLIKLDVSKKTGLFSTCGECKRDPSSKKMVFLPERDDDDDKEDEKDDKEADMMKRPVLKRANEYLERVFLANKLMK